MLKAVVKGLALLTHGAWTRARSKRTDLVLHGMSEYDVGRWLMVVAVV